MKGYLGALVRKISLLVSVFLILLLSGTRTFAQSPSFKLKWAGANFDAFTLNGVEYWTAEDGGRIRHTIDGGASWTPQSVPAAVKDTLHRIFFLSDGITGWAVGQNGWIVYTLDAGAHWSATVQIPAVVPAEGPLEELYGVRFLGPNRGWVIGKHGIWYTINGGTNLSDWTRATLLNQAGVVLTPTETASMELYSLDITPVSGSNNIGLGLAVGEPGWVLRSTNLDGTIWQLVWTTQQLCPMSPPPTSDCEKGICQTPPLTIDLWGVKISHSAIGPLALMNGGSGGACGMILSSVDNGTTWIREYHECNCPTGYAPDCKTNCASDPAYNPNGTTPYRLQYFRTIYGTSIFNGDNSAIASGYNGQHLYRYFSGTPQTGHWIWRDRSSFAQDFINATTSVVFPLQGPSVDPAGSQATGKGLIVGEGGHIRKTTNGGETWNDSVHGDPWRIKDVYFMNESTGWQVGQLFRLAKTTTGGQFWNQASPTPQFGTNNLLAITFSSDQVHGIAVGDTDTRSMPDTNYPNKPKILITTDNGATTWREPLSISESPGTISDSTQLRAVAYAGGQSFWTAGQNGLIYATTNNGDTWRQYRPTGIDFPSFMDRQFEGVSFHDTATGIFVGTHNTASGIKGVAYQYRSGVWTELTPIVTTPPTGIDIASLNGVDATGNVAYAVGVQIVNGARQGLILSSTFSGGTFSMFAPVSNHPVVLACTAGNDLGRIAVLNRVRVAPAGDPLGNVWVGGECGRVWRLTGSTWVEQKSLTDAHMLGISFPPGPNHVGFFGCHRQSDTQQSIVTYSP